MTKLISKVQHNIFEIGEFVDEQRRSYDETINLVESFPWEMERQNLIVSLTNPSVSIEGRNDDFLKLGLFYNGKFVLHYFSKDEVLFTKSFTDIKGSYVYIKNFFEQDSFNTADFKKENTWLQTNLKHFVSQDFHYTVNKAVMKRFLWNTSGFNIGASLFMIGIMSGMMLKASTDANYYAASIIMVAFVFFICGFNFIIFFNFYRHVKNKILIMSKGNDVFYYGEVGNPKKYSKSEIIRFTTIKVKAARSPINGFAVIVIALKDGTELQIPNLLVDDMLLHQKLSGIPNVQMSRLPLMRD